MTAQGIDAFLDHLSARGPRRQFSIGQRVRVHQLIETLDPSIGPDRLPSLLAPILATTSQEQEEVRRAFEAWFQPAAPPPDTPPPPAPPARVLWLPVVLCSFLLLAVVIRLVPEAGIKPAGLAPIAIGPAPLGPEVPPSAITVTPLKPSVTAFEGYSVPFELQALSWLPLVLLLAYFLHRRHLVATVERRSGSGPTTTPGERRQLTATQAARATTLALRRRESTEHRVLDPAATIRATVRSLGFPTLRYRSLTRTPEYLVLVERQAQRDHLALYLAGQAGDLKTSGIHIHLYYFAGDPRVCAAPDGNNIPLAHLRQRYPGHRLVVLGAGITLADTVHGTLTAGGRELRRWPKRALLTPRAPGEWGPTERTLVRHFPMAPATTEGWQAIVDRFEEPARPGDEPTGLRREPYLEPVRTTEDVAAYIAELRVYLGERPARVNNFETPGMGIY
ncbi:MAG: hypothetical protein FJW40_19420 [Acidobacteria bacterium]|nr:hypothetical protein [Acidobacteriota bacterium]